MNIPFGVIILVFLITGVAYGEVEVLTLKKFIALTEKHDPKYNQIFLENERLKYIKDKNLPSRQFTLTISDEYGFSNNQKSNTSVINGKIEKEIIESGTEFSLSQLRITRPDRKENVTQFRIEQSLYKNFLGRDVRLKKISLKHEKELGKLKVLEEYEEYLLSLANTYLDYQKAYLDAKLSEKFYHESLKLERNVRNKLKSKIANRTDLNRSSLLVLLKKEDLINKKKALDLIKKEVSKLTGLKVSSLIPSLLGEKYLSLTQWRGYFSDSSTKKPRALLIAELEEEIAKKNAILKNRENDFSLDLIAGYSHDDSKRFSSIINRDETVVGLKLEIPLGDSKGNAESKIAKIEQYRAQFKKEEATLQIDKNLTDLKSELNELEEKVKINKRKIEISKQILQDEQRRYTYGKIGLEKLIEISNNYAEYRFKYQASVVDLGKTIFKLYALKGRLIEIKDKL